MKIGIVSQYYAPEDARIPTGIARELVRRGHSVRVLTAFPSYPLGRVFDGYRQQRRYLDWDGDVLVERVPTIVAHSSNPLTRIANYLSFGIASTVFGSALRGADVIYVYATQMTAAIGPVLWRAFGGPPFVLHVQDIWPESITESSLVRSGLAGTIIASILRPVLRGAYRRAGSVVAIAPTMRKLLVERGAQEARALVVYNWADDIASIGEPVIRASGETRVVYAGNFGPMQNLDLAIKAAARMKALAGFSLTLFGSGIERERLEKLIEDEGATNVTIRDRVPTNAMPDVYAESDFQLVTLRDIPIFRATIPSKLGASLAAGIPVITNVGGDAATIVAEQRLGLVSTPGDVNALVDAFFRAHTMSLSERRATGARAREYFERNLTLAQGVDGIEGALSAATTRT